MLFSTTLVLLLASSLQLVPPPGSQVIADTQARSQSDSSCRDKDVDCPALLRNHSCQTEELARHLCPLSCQVCCVDPSCRDKDDACPALLRNHSCHEELARRLCPLSCRVCCFAPLPTTSPEPLPTTRKPHTVYYGGLHHPGFHNTGHISWRDCTDHTHNAWVRITKFDITPSPVRLPGDMYVTIDSAITHKLESATTLDVLIEKKLLGRWTKLPCVANFGSCHHDDPCTYLQKYARSGTCPAFLTANGIPCTCPFSPMILRMNHQVITVTSISSWWNMIFQNGQFHMKLEMKDKRTGTLRGCLEAYLDFTH